MKNSINTRPDFNFLDKLSQKALNELTKSLSDKKYDFVVDYERKKIAFLIGKFELSDKLTSLKKILAFFKLKIELAFIWQVNK